MFLDIKNYDLLPWEYSANIEGEVKGISYTPYNDIKCIIYFGIAGIIDEVISPYD